MIVPTNGRIVWYYPGSADPLATVLSAHAHPQPLAAIVAWVWNNHMVNLVVFTPDGTAPVARTSVMLLQDDDAAPEGQSYCAWMPYQLGQAARAEAAEAKIQTVNPVPQPPSPQATQQTPAAVNTSHS